MSSLSSLVRKSTGGIKNFIDSVKSELPSTLSSYQPEVQTFGSDDDGESSPISDSAYIAKGKRGISVFTVEDIDAVRKSVGNHVVLHVNFRNESVQVFRSFEQRNYKCTDIINARYQASDIIYFETKRSRSIHPKMFKFNSKYEADRFVNYIKSIIDYGDVIWRSFDQLDYSKSGTITSVDIRNAMLVEDIISDDAVLDKIIALAHEEGRFQFRDFIDALVNRAVFCLRDCLLELLMKVTEVPSAKLEIRSSLLPDASLNCAKTNEDLCGEPYDLIDLNGATEPLSHSLADISMMATSAVNSIISPVTILANTLDAAELNTSHSNRVRLVPGEAIVMEISSVRWVMCGDEKSETKAGLGDLIISNYRLIILPSRRCLKAYYPLRPSFFDEFTIPLQLILKINLTSRAPSSSRFNMSIFQNEFLELVTKDGRILKLTSLKACIDTYSTFEVIFRTLQRGSTEERMGSIFCYKYEARFPIDGWIYSDIMLDYMRMGIIGDSEWSIMDNRAGQISKSYPYHFAYPSCMSPDDIIASAAHRAQGRVPALTYRHSPTQTALVRSSQPRTGLTENILRADVALLNAYRRSGTFNSFRENERPAKFYVFDARSKLSVMANKTIGKGTEVADEYNNTEIVFCNIDNMHVMRDSFKAFCAAMFAPSHSNDSTFHTEIAASGWLAHCGKVLDSAIHVAKKLHVERCSVLVHCSDGWDRTPQICSIAQILLDPYYRTLEGFFTVVEKEWCAFGHKLKDRWCHTDAPDPNQRSPIFIQFLNIIYNVMTQSNNAFEYNDNLLVFVADHVSSGLFGNFIENSELIRKTQFLVAEKTQSIWSYVFHNKSVFMNANYRPCARPIWPSSDSRHITIWNRYFSRWDENAHPIEPFDEWKADW